MACSHDVPVSVEHQAVHTDAGLRVQVLDLNLGHGILEPEVYHGEQPVAVVSALQETEGPEQPPVPGPGECWGPAGVEPHAVFGWHAVVGCQE